MNYLPLAGLLGEGGGLVSSLSEDENEALWSGPLYTPELKEEPECRGFPVLLESGTVGGDTFFTTGGAHFPLPPMPLTVNKQKSKLKWFNNNFTKVI